MRTTLAGAAFLLGCSAVPGGPAHAATWSLATTDPTIEWQDGTLLDGVGREAIVLAATLELSRYGLDDLRAADAIGEVNANGGGWYIDVAFSRPQSCDDGCLSTDLLSNFTLPPIPEEEPI